MGYSKPSEPGQSGLPPLTAQTDGVRTVDVRDEKDGFSGRGGRLCDVGVYAVQLNLLA